MMRLEYFATLGLGTLINVFLLRSLGDFLFLGFEITKHRFLAFLLSMLRFLFRLALYELFTKLEDLVLTVIVVNTIGKLIGRSNLRSIDFLYHSLKIL